MNKENKPSGSFVESADNGAKPREIRFANEQSSLPSQPVISEEEVIADENPENKEWHKI